jgi:hypothetical protein
MAEWIKTINSKIFNSNGVNSIYIESRDRHYVFLQSNNDEIYDIGNFEKFEDAEKYVDNLFVKLEEKS